MKTPAEIAEDAAARTVAALRLPADATELGRLGAELRAGNRSLGHLARTERAMVRAAELAEGWLVDGATPELLALRSEVGRLEQRREELRREVEKSEALKDRRRALIADAAR